jgi:hypothetical protein
MPFWLHESVITQTFKRMPQRYKLFFTLLIVLFPSLIWFGLCYVPAQRFLSQQKNEIIELTKQQAQLQKIAVTYDGLINGRNELCGELAKNSFVGTSLQEIIDDVLWRMHQSGVVCRGIKQESCAVKEFFTDYQLLIEGKGEFGNILTFFHQLQLVSACLMCESLVLHESKKQKIRMAVALHLIIVPCSENSHLSLIRDTAPLFPLYANLRNPFVMGAHRSKSSQPSIFLEGIVSAGQSGAASALMACGDQREIVAQGDIFHGYLLASVDKTSVVLTKGKIRTKLTIE